MCREKYAEIGCQAEEIELEYMSEAPFDEPRLAINRVYTRQGDGGDTALVGGHRVPKDSQRIEAYGTVDELNAFVGAARATLEAELARHPALAPLSAMLLRVQHELFNLGSILATLPEDIHPKQARVTETDITRLESEMDAMNRDLTRLRSFTLPGGSRLNAELHICRTVCRRAERRAVTLSRAENIPDETVRYLNRLSDAFFVWGRWVSHAMESAETLWEPNQSATGQTGA